MNVSAKLQGVWSDEAGASRGGLLRLVEYDQDVVEIVQFGSSIYAPERSKDVDLLVITKKAKEYGGYLDAANPEDTSIDVDVLALNVDDRPREELLRGVLGDFKILYGSGEYLLKYARELGDPTFEEAKSSLRVAVSLLKLALETANPSIGIGSAGRPSTPLMGWLNALPKKGLKPSAA
jgi:hypothetical protein